MATVPNTSVTTYYIANLLDKMTSLDKDFRFMATNDLMTELQKDSLKMDDDSERRVVRTLLRLLEDKSGEVQNLAVRCMGLLALKLKEANVEFLIQDLCRMLLNCSGFVTEEIRGICGISLKTVINTVPLQNVQLATIVCRHITDYLVSAIVHQEDVAIKLECLELLADLLARFGSLMTSYHDSILELSLSQLKSSGRLALRKRAIGVLSQLVLSCSVALYRRLMEQLLNDLQSANKAIKPQLADVKTTIQCLAALKRDFVDQSNYQQLTDLVLVMCELVNKVDDDEVREFTFLALESFFGRAPRCMSVHLPLILKLCKSGMCHDPNYNYDDGDDNMMQCDDDGDINEDEFYDDGDYSDDDDVSWKVRRAAVKCLDAIISIYPDQLINFYSSIAPYLIRRFIEREENVKGEIFSTFITLLKQTRNVTQRQNRQQLMMTQGMDDESNMEDDKNPLALLSALIPDIVQSLRRQIQRHKSVTSHNTHGQLTRQWVFLLLKELTQTLAGCFASHVATLLPCVLSALNSCSSTNNTTADQSNALIGSHSATNNNMRVEMLVFLNSFLASHDPSCFTPHVNELVKAASVFANDAFYRICSESILLIQHLIGVIKPQQINAPCSPAQTELLLVLYRPVLIQLQANDRDVEVKERALSTLAHMLHYVGDCLVMQLPQCLPALCERLGNEITRLQAIKALHLIVTPNEVTQFKVDIRSIMPLCIQQLAVYLRKNDRNLKLASLSCLDAIWRNYGQYIQDSELLLVMQEISPIITECDLQLSALTVQLATDLLLIHGVKVTVIMKEKLLSSIIDLACSPLLHGAAADNVLKFFYQAGQLHTSDWNFRVLLSNILQRAALTGAPYVATSTLPGASMAGQHSAGAGYQHSVVPSTTVSSSSAVSVAIVPSTASLYRDAYPNLARCMAEVLRAVNNNNHTAAGNLQLNAAQIQEKLVAIDEVIVALQNEQAQLFAGAGTNIVMPYLYLLTLGDLGKCMDFSSKTNLLSVIQGYSDLRVPEELKTGAAITLGKIALGNLDYFVPFILNEITRQSKQQYFLLHSLREVIDSVSMPDYHSKLSHHAESMWSLLLHHADFHEEGIRNLVAECLGKLVLLDPKRFLEDLMNQMSAEHGVAALKRGTLITTLKFAIVPTAHPVDALIRAAISRFVATLQDSDLQVRKVALVTLNTVAHNKPALIWNHLETIMPALYEETKVKKELIREVEMGPFKHIEDDGLDLRKVAFECMYTLLQSRYCLEGIDVAVFLEHVELGLRDQPDIRMLVHLMLVRCCQLRPMAVLAKLDQMLVPLKNTLTNKPKTDSVKQEVEKQDELKRAAMRVIVEFNKLPDADKNRQMTEFMRTVITPNSELNNLYIATSRTATEY